MAKNIEINIKTSSGYETLYPENQCLKLSGGTMSGSLLLKGNPDSGNANEAVNLGYLNIIFPIGMIVIWSNTVIPLGWHICDGTNNTPDLRNRFVVCSGDEYNNGDTGGEKTHILTESEMPSHTHNMSSIFNSNYRYLIYEDGYSYTIGNSGTSGSMKNYLPKDSSVSFLGRDSILAETGGSQAHENRPPYYALYYIMRIA